MKRVCMLASFFLIGLFGLQAQECEGHLPRILNSVGWYQGGVVLEGLDVSGCTSLTDLYIDAPFLTSLNVRGCTSLTSLKYPTNYDTTECDISGCTALTNLVLRGAFSNLNVSGCTSLTELYLNDMQLINLDVSGCTVLTDLSCANNRLKSLNVKGITALKKLNCSNNLLTKLDMDVYMSLVNLNCSDNQLKSLDVHGFMFLEGLDCSKNNLTDLKIGNGNTSLRTLNGSSNQLSSLDVSGCTSLEELDCSKNILTDINLGNSGYRSWRRLNFSFNQLPKLDLNYDSYGAKIDCSNNNLKTLTINRGGLSSLNCSSNQLRDLSINVAIGELDCSDNNLKFLDLSNNCYVRSLSCARNHLRSLNTSGCSDLENLDCSDNHLMLSLLYDTYCGSVSWNSFVADNQSDSVFVLVDQPWDLSTEWIIGKTFSSFDLTDAEGQALASNLWTEDRFVFEFHDLLEAALRVQNSNYNNNPVAFTWHISVVEELPVNYFTIQVAGNNSEWGMVTASGEGTYAEGTEVTISAIPQEGCRFVNWTKEGGEEFSKEAIHTFTITENMELIANFEKLPDNVANESRQNENFTVYVQDRTICLSENRGTVQVFNTLGQCIYIGANTRIPVRQRGVYIVRFGVCSYKVAVK